MILLSFFFFFNDTATTEIYTLSLHDALPIFHYELTNRVNRLSCAIDEGRSLGIGFQEQASNRLQAAAVKRSEEHTSELQSRLHLVCRLLLEKKKTNCSYTTTSRADCRIW